MTFYPENLRVLMAHRNLTRTQVAKKIDVSPTTISLWTNGSHPPRNRKILRLSRELGVSESFFTTPLVLI